MIVFDTSDELNLSIYLADTSDDIQSCITYCNKKWWITDGIMVVRNLHMWENSWNLQGIRVSLVVVFSKIRTLFSTLKRFIQRKKMVYDISYERVKLYIFRCCVCQKMNSEFLYRICVLDDYHVVCTAKIWPFSHQLDDLKACVTNLIISCSLYAIRGI